MHYRKREDRFMRAGHFGGLKFDDGWFFYQVTGTEYVEAKPITLLNENGNEAAIGAQTAGSDQDEIEDQFNQKVLEPNDDERNSIFQILYGIAPSRMQVFNLFGRDRNVALEDYDEPGDVAPYLNGYDTPYNNPSHHSEIMYVNSMSPLRLQAYNPTDEALKAQLSFHVNKMRYVVVTDQDVMRAILNGQQRAHLSQAGLGIQRRNQVGVPAWMNEAFGEHIYTTSEILNSGDDSGSGFTESQDAVDLQGAGGGA